MTRFLFGSSAGGHVATPVTIANGGTGQTSAQAALDALAAASGSLVRGDIFIVDSSTNVIRLARGSDNQMLRMNGSDPNWETVSSGITESSEASTTAVTDNAENAYGTANMFIQPFTLPTDDKLYVISNITWKNGSVADGDIMCGCWSTNANHEDRAPLACLGRRTTASGTDTTQSCGAVSPNLWRGGDAGFIFGHCSSNSHMIRRQTGLSNEGATISTSYTTDPPTFMNTNATLSTAHPYLTISYYGYS